ncbi:hypothetical protein HYT56_05600 [Candidatus Woesearchaeota archaeon]|nr:hypothetical protein [Candidatus Woesearchaeota archaeon]
MKLPKLKKTKKVSLSINLGEKYLLKLPLDSSLIKNIPKITDLAMDRKNNFHDQNKLQLELQHLSDLILEIETKKKKS